MKTKIIAIAITALIGLPVAVSGSSIISSLIDGKTTGEAEIILAGQIDGLLGRVAVLEEEQDQTAQVIDELKSDQDKTELEIERLRLENEILKAKAENDRIKEETEAKTAAKIEECKRLIMFVPVVPVVPGGTYNQVRVWGGGKSIVDLHEKAKWFLSHEGHPDTPDDMEMVRAVYAEAKPLYEAYVAQCE